MAESTERRNEMKVSELIEQLQDLQEKQGDIELLVTVGSKFEDEGGFIAGDIKGVTK